MPQIGQVGNLPGWNLVKRNLQLRKKIYTVIIKCGGQKLDCFFLAVLDKLLMCGPVQLQLLYHFKLSFVFCRQVFLVIRLFSRFGNQCFGSESLKLHQVSPRFSRYIDHCFGRSNGPVVVHAGFGDDGRTGLNQFLMTWFDSISFFITDPAPITQLLPMETNCFVTAPLPTKLLLSMVTPPFRIAPVAIWQ